MDLMFIMLRFLYRVENVEKTNVCIQVKDPDRFLKASLRSLPHNCHCLYCHSLSAWSSLLLSRFCSWESWVMVMHWRGKQRNNNSSDCNSVTRVMCPLVQPRAVPPGLIWRERPFCLVVPWSSGSQSTESEGRGSCERHKAWWRPSERLWRLAWRWGSNRGI